MENLQFQITIRVFCVVLGIFISTAAFAGETDQYMTWDLELEDCAEELNTFLNESIQTFLDKANRRSVPIKTPEELTRELYLYLFRGLHGSKVRTFLQSDPSVDRHPDRSIPFYKYQRMSIYRSYLPFPFILPMARTVRIGDVYLGIDKIGHFFGYGRRYYQRYLRYLDEGATEAEAVEKVVKWGIFQEQSMVGGLTDGIFSPADLEANYQGMLCALELSTGNDPILQRDGEDWVLTRPIDIRAYVTPDFDESYNNNYYLATRKRKVLPRLESLYCGEQHAPAVKARFERYAAMPQSAASRILDDYFASKEKNRQRAQSLEGLCGGH